jgi:uncharacterized SAM-binding protein YcdF (DUF218 family)
MALRQVKTYHKHIGKFLGSFFVGVMLLMAGPFLVIESAPHPAQAIVVIGGDHKPARISKTIELYQEGYAPIVIISAGTSVLEGEEWMAEAEVMKKQALSLGLPERAIVVEAKSLSTYENALYSKQLCQKNNITSILLVTSAYHSRRAYRTFREEMGTEVSVSIQPADVNYCGICWPLHLDQAYVVGYEYYNWVKYWVAQATSFVSQKG